MKFFRKSEMETGQGNDSDKKATAGNELFYEYHFRFESGDEYTLRINLDPGTLQLMPDEPFTGDAWTRLEHHQCENCPLEAEKYPHCPVALSIEHLVKTFSEKFSYESSEIHVRTQERSYSSETTMQKGISSILGILMVTSGCPIMDKLRPMVRFHLPFPSVLDTTVRTTSTYLLGQFFLQKRNMAADFTFDGLVEIYKNVNKVNRGMSNRIRSMAGKDASVNALIILDIFAVDIPLSIEDQIADLEPFFAPYFS